MSFEICFMDSNSATFFPRIRDNVDFFDNNVSLQYNAAVRSVLKDYGDYEYSSTNNVRKDGNIVSKTELCLEAKTILNILHYPMNYVNANNLSVEGFSKILRLPFGRVYIYRDNADCALLKTPLSIPHTDSDWCDIYTCRTEFVKFSDFLNWIDSFPDKKKLGEPQT